MYIDTHVHCRDEEQNYKETIAHALEVARDSGVSAIFDMPNPKRPVFNRQRVEERLALAKRADIKDVFYGLFIGATADKEQLKQAVAVYKDFFPQVVGFKLFAGHSVGNLGVVRYEDQALVYETLATEGYDGVLFVHSEKEDEMNEKIGNIFVPTRPVSHCLSRPWQAEFASVKDQIALARKYGFKGKLHIAHISHPKSVDLVMAAQKSGLDISCGVCPHHFIYSYDKMEQPQGLLWKMNPPLRQPGIPQLMLEYLREGKINWIETDHAPHGNYVTGSLDEKLKDPFMSGIPGLPWWPLFSEYLRKNNFSESAIRKVTFDNAAERFQIDIKRQRNPIKDRRADYPFNPYAEIEQIITYL